MKKNILTFIFFLLLLAFFSAYAFFAYKYTDFIKVPHSIYHDSDEQHVGSEISTQHKHSSQKHDHEFADSYSKNNSEKSRHHKDMEDGHKHEHSELDYIHTRILNHPWNNFAIIIMIFVQGLFYSLLGFILWKKTFYE